MKIKGKKKSAPRHQPAHLQHLIHDEHEDVPAAPVAPSEGTAAASVGAEGAEGAAAAAVAVAAPLPPGVRAGAFPIFKQLQSENSSDREFACSGVANALLGPQVYGELVSQGISHVLIHLLADPERAVQVEAAGALRNLCLTGGEAIYQRLLDENVFNGLSGFLRARMAELPAAVGVLANPSSDQEERVVAEQTMAGLDHGLHVVWELCETGEMAVALVNSHGLLPIVFDCLRLELPTSLTSVAAQCLLTVSEENASVELLAQTHPDFLPCLSAHISSPSPALRASVAGIVFNLRGSVPAEALPASISTLAALVAEDTLTRMAAVSGALAEAAAAESDTHPAKVALDELKELLTAQQTALEVLANICATEDSGDGWEDADGAAESMDDDAQEDEEPVVSAESSSVPAASPLITMVLQSGAAGKLLQAAAPLPRDLEQLYAAQSVGLALLRQRAEVQLRAVACVGNLLENMPSSALQAPEASGLWASLCHLGASMPTHASADFPTIVTSTLWTLLRACRRTPETSAFLAPTAEQVQVFSQLAMASTSEQVRCNAAGLLGGLALYPSALPVLQGVGETLLHAVSVDPSPWVLAEGLNSIFDVFAEPEVNHVFVALGMMAKLHALLPVCKARLKELKRSKGDRQLVGRLSDACLNLKRFVDYKRKQF